MANLLVIEKQTGGYFKFTLNGDTATAVTSIKNDLLAVGTQLHFKTGNGANIIKEQFIYPEDVTIISGGTFTFTTVAQVWNKLIEIDYFAWLGNGGTGGVSRFDDLADTFEYVGQAGKVVVVDNSELKLIPVTFYNKRLFTDLEDTPNSLVPNKMVVVNPEGSALILQDQPQAPEQLLNSVGYFDYNDLATQTTPLDAVTNVPLKLVNDTEGANTNTSENPYGVSYVWDYTTNQFNFSELSIGDTIDIRIHVQVTTTTANQKVNLDAKFGIGSVSEFTNSIYENQFKTAGIHEINFVAPFYMGSTYITDYPAELYLTTDANATVKVNGWYVRIIRKNINIITVDYEVPDATTLAKGIVRLAGDLGGTANSPTVPGLANKVPTSRIIETTSPLLGGGALTSDLVLSIQQANSVQSGYLSFADWSTFNNKANDAAVVHLAGTETITGLKTFSSDLNVSDLYVNGYSGFSGRLSLKQANSVAFSGIGYTTVNALGTSALSINFRQTDGTNKTMQINANLIGAAARVFQFPDADGTVALTSQLHNAVTIGTANGLSLSTQVLSLGLASASTNGALSSTDWNTFNNKQNALTNPITGTGTTNYLPKFTGSTALGNSLIYEIGSTIGIGTTSPFSALHISRNASELLRITRGSVSDFSFDLGASNDLYIKNNGVGTTPLTILGSGNVGIGTTSPVYKFHVNDTSDGIVGHFSGGVSNYTLISFKSNEANVYSTSLGSYNSGMLFRTGATDRMYINTSGNVGIGTTTIDATYSPKLHIESSASDGTGGLFIGSYLPTITLKDYSGGATVSQFQQDGTNLFIKNNGNAITLASSGNVGIGTTAPNSNTNRTTLTLNNSAWGGQLDINVGGTNHAQFGTDNFNSGLSCRIQSQDGIVFNAGGANERMRITSGGNVGIGTTSPNSYGAGFIGLTLDGSTTSFVTARANGVNKITLSANGGGGTPVIQANDATTALGFQVGGSERMRITSGGNVGIGTTAPTSKLHLYDNATVYLDLESATASSLVRLKGGNYSGFSSLSSGVNQWFVSGGGASQTLVLGTADTERMRITSGGVVCIGTNSAFDSGIVCSDGGTSYVPYTAKIGTTSSSTQMFFRNPNGIVGSISTSGSLTSFNVTSDYRLKQDFKSFNGLDLVSKIKVYDYAWKADNSRMNGVIAHELQEVVPYAVTGEKDAKEMQQVDYSKLVPILVQAIKELKTEIETLKK